MSIMFQKYRSVHILSVFTLKLTGLMWVQFSKLCRVKVTLYHDIWCYAQNRNEIQGLYGFSSESTNGAVSSESTNRGSFAEISILKVKLGRQSLPGVHHPLDLQRKVQLAYVCDQNQATTCVGNEEEEYLWDERILWPIVSSEVIRLYAPARS